MCDNEWLLYRRWCFEGLQLGIWFHAIRAGQSAQWYTHYEKWFWVILNDKRNLSVVKVPIEHSLAACYLLALSFVSLISLFVLIAQLWHLRFELMMLPENMLTLAQQEDRVLNLSRRLRLDHTHSPIHSWAPNVCDYQTKGRFKRSEVQRESLCRCVSGRAMYSAGGEGCQSSGHLNEQEKAAALSRNSCFLQQFRLLQGRLVKSEAIKVGFSWGWDFKYLTQLFDLYQPVIYWVWPLKTVRATIGDHWGFTFKWASG